jgi:hypothetical protein
LEWKTANDNFPDNENLSGRYLQPASIDPRVKTRGYSGTVGKSGLQNGTSAKKADRYRAFYIPIAGLYILLHKNGNNSNAKEQVYFVESTFPIGR